VGVAGTCIAVGLGGYIAVVIGIPSGAVDQNLCHRPNLI
jgi:hypothetical protein